MERYRVSTVAASQGNFESAFLAVHAFNSNPIGACCSNIVLQHAARIFIVLNRQVVTVTLWVQAGTFRVKPQIPIFTKKE